MKKETTSIEPDENDTVSIQVPSECADSLYEYLKKQKVDCTQPKDITPSPFSIHTNATGKYLNERGTFVKKIIAKGTIDQIKKLRDDWKKTKPKRISD